MKTMNIKIKTIKKTLILFVLALLVMPLTAMAQDSIFEKYSDDNDVTFVSIKPKMFQMLAKIDIDTDDPEAQEFLDMVNSITSFKTMATDNKSIASDIGKWVDKRKNSLEELMEVKDDGMLVKFYVKEGKDEDHVSELLMFVTGLKNVDVSVNDRKFETVLLSLTGDIDLNKINSLTKKMNLPEELNEAGNKNK